MSEQEAAQLCGLLNLDKEVARSVVSDPDKHPLDDAMESDSLIYWLREVIQVYGISMKALIEEESAMKL